MRVSQCGCGDVCPFLMALSSARGWSSGLDPLCSDGRVRVELPVFGWLCRECGGEGQVWCCDEDGSDGHWLCEACEFRLDGAVTEEE